ncbi:hypothetical protein D3C77_388490 [compost metagenome]
MGTGQQQLARCIFVGLGGRTLHGSEEAFQGAGNAGVGIGQHAVERCNLIEVRRRIAVERRGGTQLAFQVTVVDPAYIGQGGAGTDEHVAVLLRAIGPLHVLLARITSDIGVGNVVTRGVQARLTGAEPRHSDVDQTRHGSNLIVA